jgi:cob(I)alamin adenosyltransferase
VLAENGAAPPDSKLPFVKPSDPPAEAGAASATVAREAARKAERRMLGITPCSLIHAVTVV